MTSRGLALASACASCAGSDAWVTDPDGGAPTVALSEEVVCADPAAREGGPFERVEIGGPPGLALAELVGAGVLVADFTGDGTADLLFPGPIPSFWEGAPDAAPRELPGRLDGLDLTDAVGGSVADADGDGDLDALVTRWRRPDVLLSNDGEGRFVDVTARAGLGGGATRHSTSAWGDLDRDGDLDLFVGTYGQTPGDGYSYDDPGIPPSEDPAELWENLGDGTFADRSDRLPREVHEGYTFQASWLDVRGDGFPELFVWNDFGSAHPSLVLANEGGDLTWTPGESNVDRPFEDMGVAVADLDEDGLPDFATTSFRKIGLLISRPSDGGVGAVWVDEADARGLRPAAGQAYGWGASFGDLDADGAEELVVVFGYWSTYPNDLDPRWQNDAIYVEGAAGYTDVGRPWQAYEPFVSRGLVLADVDDDGYLDLVKRFLDRPAAVHLSRCDARAWLRVAVRDRGRNGFGVGARITATGADGRRRTRWIEAGSTSQFVGGPPEAHFGLGDLDAVDLEVRWPDGQVTLHPDVPTRRRVTIAR